MSEFKCLVCKSPYFRKGYYEICTDVEVYLNGADSKIYTETTSNSELDFRVSSNGVTDHFAGVYKYVCEDCGYIMSFTKEKKVQTREQEEENERKAAGYDWSEFGKKK